MSNQLVAPDAVTAVVAAWAAVQQVHQQNKITLHVNNQLAAIALGFCKNPPSRKNKNLSAAMATISPSCSRVASALAYDFSNLDSKGNI